MFIVILASNLHKKTVVNTATKADVYPGLFWASFLYDILVSLILRLKKHNPAFLRKPITLT